MHRLEITGATPEELYVNSLNMLSMLVRGSAAISTPPDVRMPAEPAKDAPSEVSQDSAASASDGASDAAIEAFGELISQSKKRSRRGSKNTEPKILNDEIPDLAKTIEHDPKEIGGKPAELTLDDNIRPRLRAIQKKCTERGMNMPDTVAYIMKLYGPFGVQKADQLKPEQFAEFMEASEAYWSGEA